MRALPRQPENSSASSISDDWLLGGANDRQSAIARGTSADVVVAGYELHDQVTSKTIDKPWAGRGDFLVDTLHEDNFYSAFLIRRSFVTGIPHRQEFPQDDYAFVLELALAKPKVAVARFSSVASRTHSHGHMRHRTGLDAALASWRQIALYKKVLVLLQQREECTELRKEALLRALWEEARVVAQCNTKEARTVIDWIKHQDPRFTPPVRNAVRRLYRMIGFEMAERVVWARRTLLDATKRRPARN